MYTLSETNFCSVSESRYRQFWGRMRSSMGQSEEIRDMELAVARITLVGVVWGMVLVGMLQDVNLQTVLNSMQRLASSRRSCRDLQARPFMSPITLTPLWCWLVMKWAAFLCILSTETILLVLLERIPYASSVLRHLTCQSFISHFYSLRRAAAHIYIPQKVQAALGLGYSVFEVVDPVEVRYDLNIEVGIVRDMSQFNTTNGVGASQGFNLPCDQQHVALARVEVHLPSLYPSAHLGEVSLKSGCAIS